MPKGKLLALLLVFGAVGTLAATGAFTTVQAERTADINVAGDANALLAIQPTEDQGNSSFIQQSGTADSTFAINLDSGEGLNANATTTAENIFNITNNGNESVDLWISTNGGAQAGNSSVNTTFYIDDQKIGGDGSQVNKTNEQPVNLTGTNNASIDEYTAFVDQSDAVISNTEAVGDTPNRAGTAVEIGSGETVTVSFAVEIEDESEINLDGTPNDNPVLQNITVLAVNDDEDQTSVSEGLETANTDDST